jgi:hypothetical protein
LLIKTLEQHLLRIRMRLADAVMNKNQCQKAITSYSAVAWATLDFDAYPPHLA